MPLSMLLSMGMQPFHSQAGMAMHVNHMQSVAITHSRTEAGGMPMHGDHMQATEINIPNGPEVNYLIGAKGAGVKGMEEATGTRILIQRADEVPPGALLRAVRISGGDAQRRHMCVQLIQTKIIECQHRDQARVSGGGGQS